MAKCQQKGIDIASLSGVRRCSFKLNLNYKQNKQKNPLDYYYYLGDLGQSYSTSFIIVETFNQDSWMAERVSGAIVICEIPRVFLPLKFTIFTRMIKSAESKILVHAAEKIQVWAFQDGCIFRLNFY